MSALDAALSKQYTSTPMRILVTGSTGGIGSAVKAAARAAGHEVATFERADFATPGAMDAIPGGLDALVFATGTCPVAPLSKTTPELFAETFRVNCALFLDLVRHIVKTRKYSAAGMTALAISSVSAREGWAGGAAYCASKGALSALCRALDAELATRHIHIEALEPRYVKTRMFDECAGRMGVDPSLAQAPEAFAREILAKACARGAAASLRLQEEAGLAGGAAD